MKNIIQRNVPYPLKLYGTCEYARDSDRYRGPQQRGSDAGCGGGAHAHIIRVERFRRARWRSSSGTLPRPDHRPQHCPHPRRSCLTQLASIVCRVVTSDGRSTLPVHHRILGARAEQCAPPRQQRSRGVRGARSTGRRQPLPGPWERVKSSASSKQF